MTRYWRPSFAPDRAASFDDVLDVIRSFQWLLSLLAGGPVGWDDLRAQLIQSVSHANTDVTITREVELIVMMSGYQVSFDQRYISDFLVLLRDVEDGWPKIMSTWIGYYRKMYDVLNLYFAVVFGEGLLEQHKFLFLAQALEGYHRAKTGSKDKRTSLAQRLRKITESVKDFVSSFVADLPTFCATVKDARNYLTHPGGGEKKEFDFPVLWRQVRTTLEICFLRDIGTQEEIISRVARRHQFRH